MRLLHAPRRLLVAFAVTTLAASAAVAPQAHATPARYVSGGTVVVRSAGNTVVDNGVVVCDTGDGVGAGGLCLPFGGGDAVAIVDDNVGEDVAFQVCVDNNGDGFCTDPDPDLVCGDDVYFSHDDSGAIYNPVGPVRTGFKSGCPGGAWRGYVVMLCDGVHFTSDLHAHPALSGTGKVTTKGEGDGNFCQAPTGKPYVATGGNHTCGLSAAEDTVNPEFPDNTFTGTLAGGPWRAPGATGYTFECRVYANGFPATTAVASGTSFSTVPPTFVMFNAAPGDTVTVCTKVTWSGTNGSGTWEDDADPLTPGVQCPAATEVAAPDLRTYTAPQRLV